MKTTKTDTRVGRLAELTNKMRFLERQIQNLNAQVSELQRAMAQLADLMHAAAQAQADERGADGD